MDDIQFFEHQVDLLIHARALSRSFNPISRHFYAKGYWELVRLIIHSSGQKQTVVSRKLGKPDNYISKSIDQVAYPTPEVIDSIYSVMNDERLFSQTNVVRSFYGFPDEIKKAISIDLREYTEHIKNRKPKSPTIREIESKLIELNEEQLQFILGEVVALAGNTTGLPVQKEKRERRQRIDSRKKT